jgi:2-oxoglutarate ferredoxin oxidoreductase subunit alpha
MSEQAADRPRLWIGGEAVAEAAIRYGVRFAAGYPISPGEKTLEYFAQELPRRGGVFIHCESEMQGIYYVMGAAAGGVRCAINSSSLGVSLMMEGVSYLVQREYPTLLINHSRGDVGSTGIGPSQADYFQMTKGAGHGGTRVIVLAPSTLQEAVDHVQLGLHLGDKYRTPVILLGDTALAQCSELVVFPDPITEPLPPKPWAVGDGTTNRYKWRGGGEGAGPVQASEFGTGGAREATYRELGEKWNKIAEHETRVELYEMEDAEYAIVAFGTCGRIAKTVVQRARQNGIRLGLIRPITVWPFPSQAVADAAECVRGMLVVEMNLGQMVEDVRLAVEGRVPVEFYGRQAGVLPTPKEIQAAMLELIDETKEAAVVSA